MDIFPKEIISEILRHLNQREQIHLRRVCKLWKNLIDLSASKEMSSICSQEFHVSILSEICSQGLYVSMIHYINDDFSEGELKNSFYDTCQYGYVHLVKLLIGKGNDLLNYGLRGACSGNHIEIVDLLIEKGADDWNGGLCGACYGDHLEMAGLMIEKGANDWNNGLSTAADYGCFNSVKLMLEKGATKLYMPFCVACGRGDLEVVNLLIEKGADYWNEGLKNACASNPLHLIGEEDYLDGHIYSLEEVKSFKSTKGITAIIKLMIDKGATNCNFCHKSMNEHLLL